MCISVYINYMILYVYLILYTGVGQCQMCLRKICCDLAFGCMFVSNFCLRL